MANDSGKRVIDWRAIRIEYETGQMSVATIAKVYGISVTTLYKQRDKHGWKRDLQREVNDRAQEKLITDLSTGGLNFRDALTDEELKVATEAAAARVVEVIREHRSGLRTARALADKMIDELTALSDGNIRDQLREFVLLGEADEDGNGGEDTEEGVRTSVAKRRQKLAQIIDKALSLPNRAGTLRDLSQVFRALIPMERQAFNLDSQPDGDSYEEILRRALNGDPSPELDSPEAATIERNSLAPPAAPTPQSARVFPPRDVGKSGGTHIPVPTVRKP